MTKQLTQAMVDKYVENGCNECPYCDSDDISGNERNFDSNEATHEIECLKCGETWHDIYKMVAVGTKNFSRTFVMQKPTLWLSAEEVNYTDDGDRLVVKLLKDGSEGSAFLYQSEFTTDEMTEEEFDTFVERIEKDALLWDAKLSIGFKQEDYFDSGFPQ